MLYRSSFDPRGGYGGDGLGPARPDDYLLHIRLAEYLRAKAQFRWLLSYDDHPLLTGSKWLYAGRRVTPSSEDRDALGVRRWSLTKRLVSIRYTAGGKSGKRHADELLITTLLSATVPVDDQLRVLSDRDSLRDGTPFDDSGFEESRRAKSATVQCSDLKSEPVWHRKR